MKPALYYAIDGGSYGIGERIVAITSEKSRQWYGRECEENTATHGALNSLKRRFKTQNEAIRHIAGIVRIRKKHERAIKKAEKAYSDAQRAMRKEIEDYNVQPG